MFIYVVGSFPDQILESPKILKPKAMKKLLFVLLATSVFISCDSNKKTKDEAKTEKTTTESTTETKNDATDNNTTTVDDNKTSTSSGWVSADETRFMTDCEGSATPKVGAARANEYCDCMLQKIKANYKSYVEADRELTRNEAEMQKLVDACNGQ